MADDFRKSSEIDGGVDGLGGCSHGNFVVHCQTFGFIYLLERNDGDPLRKPLFLKQRDHSSVHMKGMYTAQEARMMLSSTKLVIHVQNLSEDRLLAFLRNGHFNCGT